MKTPNQIKRYEESEKRGRKCSFSYFLGHAVEAARMMLPAAFRGTLPGRARLSLQHIRLDATRATAGAIRHSVSHPKSRIASVVAPLSVRRIWPRSMVRGEITGPRRKSNGCLARSFNCVGSTPRTRRSAAAHQRVRRDLERAGSGISE